MHRATRRCLVVVRNTEFREPRQFDAKMAVSFQNFFLVRLFSISPKRSEEIKPRQKSLKYYFKNVSLLLLSLLETLYRFSKTIVINTLVALLNVQDREDLVTLRRANVRSSAIF
jgi:hypothetical protein